jgi:hypothetical protein
MDVPSIFICPHCGQSVDIADVLGRQTACCPHCNLEFSLPQPPALDDRASELDGLRIRQLATLRRTTYRSRSYAIIAAGACAVLAAQLLFMTVRQVLGSGWSARTVLYVLVALLAVWGAWFFIGRVIALHREARRSPLADPETPPDFSTLSDGSQRIKNLEEIR